MPAPIRLLTVTPNPSLDVLFEARNLVWDDANRVANPRVRPGGQGVNLARAAAALGAQARAIAPIGGAIGAVLVESLRGEEVLHPVPISGQTRPFVEARDPEAGALLINPRGPSLSPAEVADLLRAVEEGVAASRPRFVVGSGSLVPGLPDDFYARIAAIAASGRADFVVDADGEAFRRSAPLATVLAPNRHEASRLLGVPVTSVDEAAGAASQLPAPWSAITLGSEGAVLAVGGDVWSCEPPSLDNVGSAVGAGDAFLAGLLVAIAEGKDPSDALSFATASGSAALTAEGSAMIEAEEVRNLLRLVTSRPR